MNKQLKPIKNLQVFDQLNYQVCVQLYVHLEQRFCRQVYWRFRDQVCWQQRAKLLEQLKKEVK